MAPDDIAVHAPASETEGKPTTGVNTSRRLIGPESEDRGGPEAPADGALASDPPKPPGVPPEIPTPDQPTPIEEPPHPIPVPADEPPPPMVAASHA